MFMFLLFGILSNHPDTRCMLRQNTGMPAILKKEKLSQAGLISCYDYDLERHNMKLC